MLGPTQRVLLEAAKREGLLVSRGFRPWAAEEQYRIFCQGRGKIFVSVTLWPRFADITIDLQPARLRLPKETRENVYEILRVKAGRRWVCSGGIDELRIRRVPTNIGVRLAHSLARVVQAGNEPVNEETLESIGQTDDSPQPTLSGIEEGYPRGEQ